MLFFSSLLSFFLLASPVLASIQMVPDEQIKITTNLVKITGANLKTGLGSIDQQLGAIDTDITEIQAKTNQWNAAYSYSITNQVYQNATNAVYTNWIAGIQARTNDWNAITNATNQINGLLASTNYWNGGGACSARVTQIEARTNDWNRAVTNLDTFYTNLYTVSNMVVELDVKTNDWNSAFAIATSNEVHEYLLNSFDSNTTVTITGSVAYAVYRTYQTNSITRIYDKTTDQHFYPASSKIYVEMWGAGGGSGLGGGGAFISGDITVTPGEDLVIIAGAGGLALFPGNAAPTYGGGGGTWDGGQGGGRSAIRRSGVDLVCAAGGGGAWDVGGVVGGGAGGITTGSNGVSYVVSGGGGGTQVAGGTAYKPAQIGVFNLGGPGNTLTGGGGGGGYFGGGGGGSGTSQNTGGGGGGSSLTNGFSTVYTCQGGNNRIPGGLTALYYTSDFGYGGISISGGIHGRSGLVVIRDEPYVPGTWIQVTPNIDYTLTMTENTNLNINVMTITTTNAAPADYKIYYRD